MRNTTDSWPIVSPPPRVSSTSYLTVGRYLYSSELLSDIEKLFGAKKGTSSREGCISASIADSTSLMRRSGVV